MTASSNVAPLPSITHHTRLHGRFLMMQMATNTLWAVTFALRVSAVKSSGKPEYYKHHGCLQAIHMHSEHCEIGVLCTGCTHVPSISKTQWTVCTPSASCSSLAPSAVNTVQMQKKKKVMGNKVVANSLPQEKYDWKLLFGQTGEAILFPQHSGITGA